MRKLFYLFMVAMCATMFTACSDDDDKDPLDDDGEGKEGVITMVYEDEDAGLWIGVETFNEGEIITIDWGDGNVEEFKSIRIYEDWDGDGEDEIHYVIDNDSWNEGEIRHEYHDSNKPYTITVKGKIKGWYCWDNLTLLDVSKCPALTELGCGYNNLTSLDVSKNTALTWLDCSRNNLTSAALNQIFRDLPQVTSGTIYMSGNPGTETCDKSIAENKGWRVI